MVEIYLESYNKEQIEYTNKASFNDLINLFYYHLNNTLFYEFKNIYIERISGESKNFYLIQINDLYYQYDIYFNTINMLMKFLSILLNDNRVQKNYNIISINYQSFTYKELDKYF